MFKGMPYERQSKERQVYKTLPICIKLIKSDVNLKFRLKVSSNVIYRRVFKETNIRTVPCTNATPKSDGLLQNLIQLNIKTKKQKRKRVILTSYWSAEI